MALDRHEGIAICHALNLYTNIGQENCFLMVLSLHKKSLPLGLTERKEQRKSVNFLTSRWFPCCGHA